MANLNAYKRILNWRPFMKTVYWVCLCCEYVLCQELMCVKGEGHSQKLAFLSLPIAS